MSALLWALPFGVLAFALRAMSFGRLTWSDEGSYAAVAMQSLAGIRIYADTQSHRPPLLYAWYVLGALADRWLGWSAVLLPRIVAAVSMAAAVIAVAYLLHRLTGELSSWLGSLLMLGFATAPLLYVLDANAEPLMLGPYAVSAVLVGTLLLDRGSLSTQEESEGRGTGVYRRALLVAGAAGLTATLATMTKQVAAVAFALPLAAALLDRGRRRRWVGLGVAYIAGAVLGAFPFFAWASASGQLREMVVFGGLANLYYVGQGSVDPVSLNLVNLVWNTRGLLLFAVSVALALAVFALSRPTTKLRPGIWYALAWLGVSAFAISMGGRFFTHYVIQALPALALLVGVSIHASSAAESHLPGGRRHRFALVASVITVPVLINALYAPMWSVTPVMLQDSASLMGELVAEKTAPGARVFVWGGRNDVLVYSRRLPSAQVRECWTYYMLDLFGQAEGEELLGVRLENPGTRILEQWERERPDAIVLACPLYRAYPGDPVDDTRVADRLLELLGKEYVRAGSTGGYWMNPYMTLWLRAQDLSEGGGSGTARTSGRP